MSILLRTKTTDSSTNLKDVLSKKIPVEQDRVKKFRQQYGSTKVGEVTIDMVSIIIYLLDILFSQFMIMKRFPNKSKVEI